VSGSGFPPSPKLGCIASDGGQPDDLQVVRLKADTTAL
jgi:hypothetical protein